MALNSVSGDAVSKNVPERQNVLDLTNLSAWELSCVRQQECKYQSNCKTPVGKIVLSALIFGGLLDWEGLEEIYRRVCEHSRPPEDGWIDYNTRATSENPSAVRRWKVDKRTRLTWESGLLGLGQFLKPDLAKTARYVVSRHLGYKGDEIDALFEASRTWWRLHLPPVLSVHLEGAGPSRAVPRENWDRLFRNRTLTRRGVGGGQEDLTQISIQQSPSPIALRATWDRFDLLGSELGKIAQALKSGGSTDIAQSQGSANALRLLKKLCLSSPLAKHVCGWLSECLQHGYDWRPGQKKNSRSVSPSTLEGDLRYLKNYILFDLNHLGATPSAQELIALYAGKLPDDLGQDKLTKDLRIIGRFHRWLVDNAEYPALKFTLNPRGPRGKGRPRLISEDEYFRALQSLKVRGVCNVEGALRVGLILGFRAGLRPKEMTALQAGDFRISSEGFVLTVKPNRHAKLKTSNARRILPLHLLLTAGEQKEVEAFVRSRQRVRGKRVRGPMLLHDAISPSDVKASGKEIERLIVQRLAEVTRDPEARFYDLRHSFASYLSATLLLPDGVDARLSPSVGPNCISRARREKLWPYLLGKNSSGRASLYAVSFLMGHASPEWTLVYYNHLLDWSAAEHVAHIASLKFRFPTTPMQGPANWNTPRENDVEPEYAIIAEQPWPEWQFVVQALSDLIDGARLPQTAAMSGIDEELLREWHGRLSMIVNLRTRKGVQRHRFVASTRKRGSAKTVRSRFVLPRGDNGLDVVGHVWAACKSGTNKLPEVAEALKRFLHHADAARCDVPFDSAREAMQYVEALMLLGFERRSFRVRLQMARSGIRSQLLRLPEPTDGMDGWLHLTGSDIKEGEQAVNVARFRISLVVDEPRSGRATPSHRVALMLAAMSASFPIL